jgi:hypothetical protein
MRGIHGKHLAEVPLAEDQHPIRDLCADSHHETLGEAVRLRTPGLDGRSGDVDRDAEVDRLGRGERDPEDPVDLAARALGTQDRSGGGHLGVSAEEVVEVASANVWCSSAARVRAALEGMPAIWTTRTSSA